jgi:aconitate hydratase
MNYLASPPLVVAYALAGTVDIDLNHRAARHGQRRQAGVPQGHLAEQQGVGEAVASTIGPEMFKQSYADVFEGDARWSAHQGRRRADLRLGRRSPPTSRTRPTSTA